MDAHICTELDCPPGSYYVTAVDAGKLWHMAGPYKTHIEALGLVDRCREIGIKNNPWASFYSWGTVRSGRTEPGSINKAGLL